jgi:hypothetical protein
MRFSSESGFAVQSRARRVRYTGVAGRSDACEHGYRESLKSLAVQGSIEAAHRSAATSSPPVSGPAT